MKILALETSSSACSVALLDDNRVKVLHQIAPMQHARLILAMIQQLFTEFSLNTQKLDAIAYGCGPASYTGIRIANSVAQGLGFAGQKPVIGVSSLAVLAQTAYSEHQCTNILVAVDARMDQIYWAQYVVDSHGLVALIGEECLCAPNEVTIPAAATDWCGVGDAWVKYQEAIEIRTGFSPKRLYSSLLPTAEALLPLAKSQYEQGNWVAASEAHPVYLR